jgi:hypothetical protein
MVDTNNSNTLNSKIQMPLSTQDIIYYFIEEVFIGIETKVYQMTTEKEGFKDKLNTREGMLYGMNLLEFYLNTLYKTLVEKSDDFIMKKFEHMGQILEMHPVYALNIITNVIMKCYPLFTRSKLNLEDKDKYIDSVKSITGLMRKYILKTFEEDLEKFNLHKNNKDDLESQDKEESEKVQI